MFFHVCLWFQVKDLTRFLDPSGLGVISFEDFYRGISAISNEGTAAHTFTFMHLADAFIQSDLQYIQVIHILSVCVFPGNRTHNLLRC